MNWMRYMMKKTVVMLLAVMLLFGICGCQNAPKKAKVNSPAPAAATRDEATGDEATKDQATGDEADGDDWSAHPLDKKLPSGYFDAPLRHRHASIETEELYQNPELPTGCESVALTAALRSLGFELEKTDFADNYLIYDEDVMWGYVGDPTEYDGAGIYPPGLTVSTNQYLKAAGSSYVAYNTMGVELEDLLKLVDDGCPVLLWTTMNYEEPIFDDFSYEYDGEEYYWFQLEHCVMLCGYDLDEGTVTLNDPLRGIETIDIEQMAYVYNEIGKMSMTIKE